MKNISFNLEKKKLFVGTLISFAYSLSLFYLYYRMTEELPFSLNDLNAHISEGLSKQNPYSLTLFILGVLWKLPHCKVMVSLFLTFLTLLSILITFYLLKYLLPKLNIGTLILASLICNMYMPIYIPFFNQYRYLGLPSFVLYHNSTYIAMRPFALLSLIIFFKLREKYLLKMINIKEWIFFASSLFITTWFKPNFMFGFAPCMLIVMIFDFIKNRGKKFLNYIVLGTAVFPTIFLMFWQQSALFGDKNGFGFSIFKVWSIYAKHPIIAIFQATAFPLIILFFNYKDLKKDKIYSFSWLLGIFNIAIYAFVHENGVRQLDGNLGWGTCFAVGVLFIASTYKFLSTINKNNIWYLTLSSSILGMGFLCWINYYLIILSEARIKEFVTSFFIN